VSKEDVKRSEGSWKLVYEYFDKAQQASSGDKAEKTKEREEQRAEAIVSSPRSDETHLIQNQVQIIWGNALYDQSQIWAGVGLDGWKAMVEDARSRFLRAACKDSDVLDALRNHICGDELDLPIEEKPQTPVAPSPPPAEKKPEKKAEKGAKGLPTLKKKKGGAKAG
jgi:hypothetical protein